MITRDDFKVRRIHNAFPKSDCVHLELNLKAEMAIESTTEDVVTERVVRAMMYHIYGDLEKELGELKREVTRSLLGIPPHLLIKFDRLFAMIR